jgi:hypothetical protein
MFQSALRRCQLQISLLVPYRADPGSDRAIAWDFCRSWWEQQIPSAEIVLGTDQGEPFSKTTAVNDAFSRSSGDVLVVADADCILEPEVVQFGAYLADRHSRLVVPWGSSIRLTKFYTDLLIAGKIDIGQAQVSPTDQPRPEPITAGMIFVIGRDEFKTVQGMDPRFRGWGHEDTAFQMACETLLGKTSIVREGWVVSLHHPRPKVNGSTVWGPEDNGGATTRVFWRQYKNASGRKPAMRALVDQHPLGD